MSAETTMHAEFAARERLTASANEPVRVGPILACSSTTRDGVSRITFRAIITCGARMHMMELTATPRLGVPFNAAGTTTYERCRDRAARLRASLVTEFRRHFVDVRVSDKPMANIIEHARWQEHAA